MNFKKESRLKKTPSSRSVAVIGLSAKFPQAKNAMEFWQNLVQGRDCISFFSDEEALAAGEKPETLRESNYIKARGLIREIKDFDADFFGCSSREAEMMDPQIRLLLECSAEALEDAGCNSENYPGKIGVYVGAENNRGWINKIFNSGRLEGASSIESSPLVEKEFSATKIAYHFNLKGPALTLDTACSTSLAAIYAACRALADNECDLALAGGANLHWPQPLGYLYHEGNIYSNNGQTRPFDAQANGTLFSDGAGIVVLKRLSDALADNDNVLGIVRGIAANNNGRVANGFTAASPEGQARVIKAALADAQIKPDSISYIEAHGTATALGDAVEASALKEIFGPSAKKYCALGSVKSNIGHTGAAAGVAGFIKTVLALQNRLIPASIHFDKLNEKINFDETPFFVAQKALTWRSKGKNPRRAAVSSFGVGGTNVHAILEEAPLIKSDHGKKSQLLTLSAKTSSALNQKIIDLRRHLMKNPGLNLADAAWTLQTGRPEFEWRASVISENNLPAAIKKLADGDPIKSNQNKKAPIVFMLPGQGAQRIDMGRELYKTMPLFRRHLDACLTVASAKIGLNLKKELYSIRGDRSPAVNDFKISQPLLFCFSYALAGTLTDLGVKPDIFIGHSMGELTAACLAGAIKLEDALDLVISRARLVESLPPGTMLAVSVPAVRLKKILKRFPAISLAAVNSPRLSVVSGSNKEIADLTVHLKKQGYFTKKLSSSRAFHSAMMEPILKEYGSIIKKARFKAPDGRLISTVTGRWLNEKELTNAKYWLKQIRQPVNFVGAATRILKEFPEAIFIELSPARELTTFLRQNPGCRPANRFFDFSEDENKIGGDLLTALLTALGAIWQTGAKINFNLLHEGERRRKVSLPTYPFERRRYWISDTPAQEISSLPLISRPNNVLSPSQPENYFLVPAWKEKKADGFCQPSGYCLIIDNELQIGQKLARRLPGALIIKTGSDYRAFLKKHGAPADILHSAILDNKKYSEITENAVRRAQKNGLNDLTRLAQALGCLSLKEVSLRIFTNQLQWETIHPEQSLILGAVKVIPKEYPAIKCQNIDLDLTNIDYEQIAKEIRTPISDEIVALRSGRRYVQFFSESKVKSADGKKILNIKDGGTYLITGGTGAIGLTLADHISKSAKVNLVLLARQAPNDFRLEKIERLKKNGAAVLTIQADVSDQRQMRNVARKIRQRFGQLSGLIHAAGQIDDLGVIQNRDLKKTWDNMSAKTLGTIILKQLFTGLDFFICCSSTSAIFGPAGEIGYVAANNFLDYFARHQTALKANRLTLSINWPAWREIGMAAASQSGREAGLRSAEIKKHHLFKNWLIGEKTDIFIAFADPKKHWLLKDHRILNRPTMPGTAWLEFARAAVSLKEGSEAINLSFTDVQFIEPLTADRPKEIRLILKKIGDGFYDFMVISRVKTGTDLWHKHAVGKIDLTAKKTPKPYRLASLAKLCSEPAQFSRPAGFWQTGPRWHGIKKISRGQKCALAKVSLAPKFSSDLKSFRLHPALLDLAVSFSTINAAAGKINQENIHLPFAYKKIKILDSLPATINAYAKLSSDIADWPQNIDADIIITNNTGRVLVEIEGFTLKFTETVASPARNKQPRNFCLDIKTPGLLETLFFRPVARPQPGPGQVEIKTDHVGLNFLDVAKALGIINIDSQSPARPTSFGSECAGVVTRLGDKVENLRVGEKVIVAKARGGFKRFVTAGASQLVKIPPALKPTELLTAPIAFLTAYYSLIEQGRLKKGDKVLIHSAAGGVGLAAVQIANWIGAEIFATVGNETKKRYLQTLGVKHVLNSRSLDFADKIMEITGGRGVDMVLNSLAGDFIPKSLSVLAPFGRFLEIGKRDILNNASLNLKLLEKNITFLVIDIDQKIPDEERILAKIVGHFISGHFRPLPYSIFPLAKIREAFSFMGKGDHIGKIIISFDGEKKLPPSLWRADQDSAGKNIFKSADLIATESADDLSLTGDVSQSLSPAEGKEIFSLIFEGRLPYESGQLIVSSKMPSPIVGQLEDARKPEVGQPDQGIAGALQRIWQKHFGREDIALNDNLFNLGGSSLDIIAINAKIKKELQIDIPAAAIFKHQTINSLVKFIKDVQL